MIKQRQAFLLVAISALFLLPAMSQSLSPAANFYINNDLVGNTLDLEGTDGEIPSTLNCNTLTVNSLTASNVIANNLALQSISTSQILSSDGSAIQFSGHVTVNGAISQSSAAMLIQEKPSFIVLNDFIVDNVVQWKTISEESFDQSIDQLLEGAQDINGWRVQQHNSEPVSQDALLAVTQNKDNKMIEASHGGAIYKTFSALPNHSELMIEGSLHFMSPFWRGQAAFMKVDGKIVWLEHHDWTEFEDVDPCSFNSNNIEQYIVKVPINVIAKHYGDNVKIEIGTTKNFDDVSECELELYHQNHVSLIGFDDFMLHAK